MKTLATLLLSFCAATTAGARSPVEEPAVAPPLTGAELTEMVNGLDTTFFAAFNACDIETMSAMYADDVEFYHDKGGLMLGREPILEATRNNICGKVRREIVDGSLEVYPMEGIGALQFGVHRFCETGADECGGIARFVHLWRPQADGHWALVRIYSYDHQPLSPEPAQP
jgi:ketosteroid isomerase-like protein